MALELVAGALLSSSLNVLFERMASYEFRNFFETQKIDMELFDELKTLLNTVNRVLDDAEDRQITSPAVKNWVDDLRDAAYETDDLLDLIAYEATAAKVEAQQQTSGKQVQTTGNQMLNLFSFCNRFKHSSMKNHSLRAFFSKDVPKRMGDIVRRLHRLVGQIVPLGLRETSRKDALPEREPTTSVVDESGIFGRDGDKEAILKLLHADEAEGNSIGVIPIVGMGGIGKTTLAQLVYNDSRAQDLFECKAWVCVSENYDGFKIKREVLNQVKNSSAYDGMTSQQIDEELKKSLKSKRYLLVLDDMWNDSYADWNKLLTPLESGECRSKIIVTTRNQSVASIMCTVPNSYRLDELDADHCWLLFVKHAFNGGTVNDERLEAIGKEIVKKCKGLPLAAKMLGGLLRRKREVTEWEDILNSNIWDLPNDNVLPALRLSYQHLPSYLKQCFAYCAIFPKDYELGKEEIIDLWMAEGLLAQPKGGKNMEELGEKCFDELVSRSFFQMSDESFFCMHDLINDLAQLIYGEFLVRMEGDYSYRIGEKTRHFSCVAAKTDSSKILDCISQAQVLRTFLTLGVGLFKKCVIADELLHNKIPCLRCLRILSLCGFENLVELPDSIGNLKHLRYLNLATTSVERLPENVCTLHNLQTLILYGCEQLVQLPENMGSLINLHCLDISVTPRLQEMPPRMGNLKELRFLSEFIVGKQNFNELVKLQQLRQISILNLENAENLSDNILKNKKHLEDLELNWKGDTEDSMREKILLEQLQPYTSIKHLSIYGYGGTTFPDWMGHSSYTNMVSLKLRRCKHCISLPPLGQLSFLEDLSISEFDAVVEVGAEFYGNTSMSMKTPFRSLKTLEFVSMGQWQGWIICEVNDSVKCRSFGKMQNLTIRNCPNLKYISTCEPTHKIFKPLNYLKVENCPDINTSNLVAISSFERLEINRGNRRLVLEQNPSALYNLTVGSYTTSSSSSIEELEDLRVLFNAFDLENIHITRNHVLQSIPLEMLPKLKSLRVAGCDNLESIAASDEPFHQPLTLLAFLMIESCDKLIYFPKGGIPAPNLTHLELHRCSNLKSLPECMHALLPSLLTLEIRFCGELESFPEGGLPANLQSLQISGCQKLIATRSQWGLQTLHALSHLTLAYYEGHDLDSFPEETLLPSTLISLGINNFPNLHFINYKGLPSSLSSLAIWGCSGSLRKRCEREKGEDWSNISHISNIAIDGRKI